MPSDRGSRPRPAIVFVHGGGWRSGDKRAGNFIRPALEFAAKDYFCVSVNYRLLDEAPIMACIADVKCAVRWLRAHADQYHVDPQRIGAYGNSAGAHLVAMLGVCPVSADLEGDGPWREYSSRVQAVVSSATPTSFLIPMSRRQRTRQRGNQSGAAPTERSEQGSDARRARGANSPGALPEETKKKISPITYVSANAPPFLLIHEVSDPVVGVYHSDTFVTALRQAGAGDVALMRIKG